VFRVKGVVSQAFFSTASPAVEAAGRENEFLAGLRQQTVRGWGLRYGLAVGAVAAARQKTSVADDVLARDRVRPSVYRP
jgi:hypothetical protein